MRSWRKKTGSEDRKKVLKRAVAVLRMAGKEITMFAVAGWSANLLPESRAVLYNHLKAMSEDELREIGFITQEPEKQAPLATRPVRFIAPRRYNFQRSS